MTSRKGFGLVLAVCVLVISIFSAAGSLAAGDPPAWAGRLVSLQGTVTYRSPQDTQWQAAQPHQTFQAGDMLRVEANGRAAVLLPNQTVVRLDQKSTLQFSAPLKEKSFFLRLIDGAAHFFSRTPRNLKVETPFVNASVEGTEFLVEVGADHTRVILYEGRVLAENEAGRQVLTKGQAVVARKGQAPVMQTVVRPRDAVAWTLFYPPVLDVSGPQGEAQSLLNVGRVDAAQALIDDVLAQDPNQGAALALSAVMRVVQGNLEEAFGLARRAVARAPELAAVHLADSYVRQALFDLPAALAAAQQATRAEPQNALAWARLSELHLSLGQRKAALAAAEKAVGLAPDLGHTQTVMGFARLIHADLGQAQERFAKAMDLDPAAPMPRLGLGLALIRRGDLAAGRAEMEVAAMLDPGNSLVRSYLGKAYIEEHNDGPAAAQLAMAKELDPKDPTPWYYDALRKQARNRPVEALADLQKAIELNDNRAVYRSRLLLDEDLAARSASLAAIYRELGFEQQALVEGWRSLNTDPGSHSAHRFMADLYGALPRHEIARVSELLQSQLLQPSITTPVSPQLSQSGLFIQQGAGPSTAGLNEYNSLFTRDKMSVSLNGVAGGNATVGSDLALSAVSGNASFSLGRFHYESDGFRENNDQEHEIYNFMTQYNITPATMVQAEFRHVDSERGDMELTFFGDFNESLRQSDSLNSVRVGGRHRFSSESNLLASINYQDVALDTVLTPVIFEISDKRDIFLGEIQYQQDERTYNFLLGMLYRESDVVTTTTFFGLPSIEEHNNEFGRFYAYMNIHIPQEMTWTFGFSGDSFESDVVGEESNQVNPKFGLTWTPIPSTKVRGAIFRSLTRPWTSQQNLEPTLEPAQIAGFSQEFVDSRTTDSWRYGVGIDHHISSKLTSGIELSWRQMDVPLRDFTTGIERFTYLDREERIGRAYLYWAPCRFAAFSAEYLYEWFDRPDEADFIGESQFSHLVTHRVPLGIRMFHESGAKLEIKATYVDQTGDFVEQTPVGAGVVSGDDQFWVVDAGLLYSLPGIRGSISLNVKNLFDEKFSFQDTNPANPQIMPGRLVLVRANLTF